MMSAIITSGNGITGTIILATPERPGLLTMHTLPAELIERILTFSDPRDVSKFTRTCRFVRKLVYEAKDQYLWRELYLGRPFDNLRDALPFPRGRLSDADIESSDTRHTTTLPWQSELQRRMQADIVASSGTRDAQLLQSMYEAFLAVVHTAMPFSQGAPSPGKDDVVTPSENLRWLDRVLRKTRALDRIPAWTGAVVDIPSLEHFNVDRSHVRQGRTLQPGPGTSGTPAAAAQTGSLKEASHCASEDAIVPFDIADVCWIPERFRAAHQMRCRLRAYIALSLESSFDVESRARMARIRRTSRTYVYDMRKYQRATLWGPYRTAADGRTVLANWEHVEHILNVVGLKLREIPLGSLGYYKKPLFDVDSLRAYSAIGSHERPAEDWAGVTGTWRRFVCFMDYRDLYMFNYSLLPPGPHDPSFFDDPFDEALRPVELHLLLISREEYFSERHRIAIDPSTPSSEDDGTSPVGDYEDPAFPTLYFKGHSHGAAAMVRGKVSTLSDGAIRWQFVTTYDGRLQWSAEAVQIGHVCSAAGVAGIWTGAHHDRDDPAGPFWMMKVSDELPEGILNTLH